MGSVCLMRKCAYEPSGTERIFCYLRSLREVPRMVQQFSTDEFSVAPDALVQAVQQLAERHAVLTAAWLESIGRQPGLLKVPEAFLLELAAVLQLQEWKRQG